MKNRRTGDVRASGTMIPAHAPNVRRPEAPSKVPGFGQTEDGFGYIESHGQRIYVGLGCGHMALGHGRNPSHECHIADCRENVAALRKRRQQAEEVVDAIEGT